MIATMEVPVTRWTSAGDPVTYVPVLEDPALEHQIIILILAGTNQIAVTCNCLNGHGHVSRGHPRQVIAASDTLTPAEAWLAYRDWHWTVKGVRV